MTQTDEKKNILRDPLLVKDGSQNIFYYGGNQEWYTSNTMAYAGCGSVACANMLRALACKYPGLFRKEGVSDVLTHLTDEEIDKAYYTNFMGSIYKSMTVYEIPILKSIYDKKERGRKPLKVLPPSFGMSLNRFIIGALKYSKKQGILLHVNSLPTAFCKYNQGLDFIKRGLDKSGAVVILTSLNRHPLRLYSGKSGTLENGYDTKKGMKSHFATITDIVESEDSGEVLVKLSTWGKVATVPYDKLCKSWKSPLAFTSCLYYFTPAKSEKIVRRDIYESTIVLIKAVFRGAFGWLLG